jgi:hypothetical protein
MDANPNHGEWPQKAAKTEGGMVPIVAFYRRFTRIEAEPVRRFDWLTAGTLRAGGRK